MAAYPGEGTHMSIYGAQERSPEEVAGQWKETTKRQEKMHKDHLAVKGNGSDILPGVKKFSEEELKERKSYFQNTKEHEQTSTYERMFHIQYDYNSKLHRDDRQHTVGLDLPGEECQRTVPVRSSSEYGRHVMRPLDDTSYRPHVRIDKIVKGFYRTRGTNIPSSNE